MKIPILTEGNRQLGLGHIIRCISLYQALEMEGNQVNIVAQGNSAVSELLSPFNHQMLDWVKNRELVREIIQDKEIVIVDSRLVDKKMCEFIAKSVKIPVFLDDTQRLIYSRGIVINRTILAEELTYPANHKVAYLLGAKYIPLTKAFWYAPIKPIRKNIGRILVTFGGSDPTNQTNRITKFISGHYPDWHIDVIIGNSFDKSTINFKDNTKIQIHNNLSGEEMKNLMLRADIAVSAGGQTLFELARIGVPTIGVQVVPNQTDNISRLVKTGFLEFAGKHEEKNMLSNIQKKLNLLKDYRIRKQKNEIGHSLIDGYGSVRIASFVMGAYRFST